MQIQCKSSVHQSRPHCVVQNRIHTCMLASSGHTSTQLPWHPHQIFTLASHHIASRVEQIRGTQCVAQRSALTVDERTRHALFGPYAQRAIARSSSIRIKTTSGSGLGLIQIGSGLGECAFSVDALKPDSIRFNVHWVSSVDTPLESATLNPLLCVCTHYTHLPTLCTLSTRIVFMLLTLLVFYSEFVLKLHNAAMEYCILVIL